MRRSLAVLIVFIILLVILIILLIGKKPIAYHRPPPPPAGTPSITVVLGTQTKRSGCHIAGALPDTNCTPGAVFTNVTEAEVCTPGYTKSVRNVPVSEKNEVYNEYSIVTHTAGQYEVDHYISLELGGSNEITNLWPEPAEPRPGFHEKDVVENYLHEQVCAGKLTLTQAQQQIATDWLAVYRALR